MISRLLSIAAVSLLSRQVLLLLLQRRTPRWSRSPGSAHQRGYLKDYHKEWDQCSQRAAAAFLSDKGEMGTVPELPEISQELKKAPADVRRNGEPVLKWMQRADGSRTVAAISLMRLRCRSGHARSAHANQLQAGNREHPPGPVLDVASGLLGSLYAIGNIAPRLAVLLLARFTAAASAASLLFRPVM